MILGHVALAGLARRTLARPIPFALLVLASCGPDLIDKTGMLLLGTPSKYLGHTLLLFVVASAALAVALRVGRLGRPGLLWWPLALLWLSHLVLDLTERTVLLWPLLGAFPVSDPYDLSEGFLAFYSGRGNAVVLAFDLACVAATLATFAWSRRRKTMKTA